MMAELERTERELQVTLANGFEIDFKIANGNLLGIGRVCYRGRDLRNPDYTIRPFLKSIDGQVFEQFRLVDAQAEGGTVRITTEVIPSLAAELEWQDTFNRQFVTMPRPEEFAVPAELVWEMEEYSQSVYGKEVPGFTYSFCLSSDAEFHTYIEQGTWEIDQLAAPVTVIAARAGGVPWEARVGAGDLFYTHEGIDFGPGENSSIQLREGLTIPEETVVWQMMPRGSGSQVFDFQAGGAGWLAMYNPVPGYIQACMRKEPAAPVIAHLERHFFPRRKGVESGKKVVLAHFPEGGMSLEEIRDDWSDVFDTVNNLWRGHFHYPEDHPDTAYSPNMWMGTLEAEPLAYRRVLDMIPILAKYGVRRLYSGQWWKSHFTEGVSDHNCCHILEYTKSEKHGGNALLKEFCDVAHRHGMEVYVWFLGMVSRESPMHAGHPDWVCLDRNGKPTMGIEYPTLCCMDYNSGWADYFAERVLAIQEKCGIDGIFIDSYHNLNFQPINYADEKLRTNMPALVEWQRRLRKAGLGIMIETQGIFGTSLNWLDRGHRKTEANRGLEHTLYKNMACIKTDWILSGRIDESFCYRATANNGPIRLETDFWELEEVTFPREAWEGFLARINHDYQAVRDRMIRRRTLSADRGVEWLDTDRKQVRVLFSFADFSYAPPPGLRVFDVTDGCDVPVADGKTAVRTHHTYRLDPA